MSFNPQMLGQNPDPYAACLWGYEQHPRYHDCENCKHIAEKTCEYGIGKMNLRDIQSAIADGKAMLASYPKHNPARLP